MRIGVSEIGMIKNINNLVKIWRKSAKTRQWGIGTLKSYDNKYCLLGAIACENGFEVQHNHLNAPFKDDLSFVDILAYNGISPDDLSYTYQCPECEYQLPLSDMIPHLNDIHLVDFEEAIDIVPKLKKITKYDYLYECIIESASYKEYLKRAKKK